MGARRPRRGTVLAPGYRILDHLHRSNHFDVFDAWDEGRWCRCILKTPRPDRIDDANTGRRLLREGRRLKRLRHPHIVSVVDVVAVPRPVVVMETLSGETVGRMVESSEGGIDDQSAAWMGIHLCSALSHLHSNGLVHLDLKPSNVVAESGRAVVIDLSSATRPGRIRAGVGTWCYMAPEQVRGGDVGTAADVWGLGMVLHEALRGTHALPDDRRRRTDGWVPQPLTRERPDSPLAEVVDRCLRFDPADRPSLTALATGLADVTGTPFPPR